jgi:F0F1-type ATP synthase beta subunit
MSAFKRSLDIEEIETAVERIKAEIRGQIPVIQQIFLEADSLANPLSQGAMRS